MSTFSIFIALIIIVCFLLVLVVMVQNRSQENKAKKIPQQRKTTLKWGSNGELSALDMVRILDRLNDQDLTECEIPLETVKEKKL